MDTVIGVHYKDKTRSETISDIVTVKKGKYLLDLIPLHQITFWICVDLFEKSK